MMLVLTFLFFVIPLALLVMAGIVYGISSHINRGTVLSFLAISANGDLPLWEESNALSLGWRRSQRKKFVVLAGALAEGKSLSDALARDDSFLPAGTALIVSAGEQTGAIAEVLREKASQETESLRRTYLGTPFVWLLNYFIAVFLVVQTIVMFQMYYIIPKFKKIFEDYGTELPATTVSLIRAADLYNQYFILLLPLIWGPIVLIVGKRSYFQKWIWNRIPWPKRFLMREEAPDLLRSLAYIVESNLPLPEAIERLADAVPKHAMNRRLHLARVALESGQNCWDTLAEQQFLTREEATLLSSAERVGNLPFVMRELADAIERRRDYRLYFLLEIIQPVVVLGLGVFVANICLAFFAPLIKLIMDMS